MRNTKHFFAVAFFSLLSFAGCQRAAETQLRVLSYNIRNANGLDGQRDYQRIADVIMSAKPDVVALQEVDSVTSRSVGVYVLDTLARLTGMKPLYGASIPFDGGKYGIGVLSREQALMWQRVPLPGREEPRSMLLVVFPEYVFCCTHFSLTEEDRLASVAIIDSVLQHFPKPVLLAGDINAEPESPVMKAFAAHWQTLSDISQPTFPANAPVSTIDYILGFRPDTYAYSLVSASTLPEAVASDHRPVAAEIRFSLPKEQGH